VPQLVTEELEAIRRFDTCTIANAIETFDQRLRNEGSTNASIRCMFPDRPTTIGYATTAKVRAASPPPVGHAYHDRTDWWTHILSVPSPRVVVVEDVDTPPGAGALVGEVHVQILLALGCVAYVTNGGVRDLPAVRRTSFQLFANHITVSHAFAHLVSFGEAVDVGGLHVEEGDLLCGDVHGVLSIPEAVMPALPGTIADLQARERRIIELCHSSDFSLEKLSRLVKELS
jgi:regulator of RNase E activity RraA